MTPRQQKLLKAIVDEFSMTADAVGSLNISDKYDIDASPATIRNDMAKLAKEGYLQKLHSSSGRVPTAMGLRFYIKELLEELETLEYRLEAEMRERLFQKRFDKTQLISEALNALAEYTKNTAVVLLNDHIYYSGLSEMLDLPEFQAMDNLRSILKLLENYKHLYSLFERYKGDKDIKILIGEETGFDNFTPYAVMFTPISLYQNHDGYLSVIGPNRMNYSKVIPAFRSVANNIEDVVKEW